MERTRGSRTVALCLFALVLVVWIKTVPANPGEKEQMELDNIHIHKVLVHVGQKCLMYTFGHMCME